MVETQRHRARRSRIDARSQGKPITVQPQRDGGVNQIGAHSCQRDDADRSSDFDRRRRLVFSIGQKLHDQRTTRRVRRRRNARLASTHRRIPAASDVQQCSGSRPRSDRVLERMQSEFVASPKWPSISERRSPTEQVSNPCDFDRN